MTDPLNATPGPFKVVEFKCSDGSPNAGVMSARTGSAVCWASGRNEAEEYANARQIAHALNHLSRSDSAAATLAEETP